MLRRNYPVSSLLRASPPPTRPDLALAGCPLRLPPLSSSVSRASCAFLRYMPSLSTPAELQSAFVADFLCNAGLPRLSDRSASASYVSGPRRAFTCVTACIFAGSPSDPFHRRLRRIRCLLRRFDCYWASDPSQAGLPPAKIHTHSRARRSERRRRLLCLSRLFLPLLPSPASPFPGALYRPTVVTFPRRLHLLAGSHYGRVSRAHFDGMYLPPDASVDRHSTSRSGIRSRRHTRPRRC